MFCKPFLKVQVLIFFIIFNVSSYAGWPEDGWVAVSSLSITHKRTALDIDSVHKQLAQEEERLARALPSSEATNIVLVSFSFIEGGETPSLHTFALQNSEGQRLVFESGWESSFIPDPTLEKANKLMRSYAPKLQRQEGLLLTEKQELVRDCIRITGDQKYFEEEIRPQFCFFAPERISIAQILARIERLFSGIKPGDAGYPIYEAFLKDYKAFERIQTTLDAIKREEAQGIKSLCDEINLDSGVSLAFAKSLAARTKTAQEKLAKQERELFNFSNSVNVTYWHSEQRLLHHLAERGEEISRSLIDQLDAPPEAVFLCFHSRFRVCPVCGHSIVRSFSLGAQSFGASSAASAAASPSSSASPDTGIHRPLVEAICRKFGIDPLTPVPFFVTSSFREEREKESDLSKEKPMPIRDFNGLREKFPAFPMCHISSD